MICVMPFLLHVFKYILFNISPCPYLPVFIYNIALLRSSKNAFIMQSKSTFLEFLDGNSLQIWHPRKILQRQILQVQMTSLQSTLGFVCLTFSFTCRCGLFVCPFIRVWCTCLSNSGLCFLAVWTVIKQVALFTFEDTVTGILRTGLS